MIRSDARQRPLRPAQAMAALLALTPMLATAAPNPAAAQTRIADHPPSFRIYDVNRRERWLQGTIARLSGTPTLSHATADAALGRLDDIRRNAAARRARHGGRLTRADLRAVNAALTRLARTVGL